MKHLILWLGSKNGEPEEGMGRQEEIEVGHIYSPASALLGCVGWGSPSIQGHSSSQVGLATQYSVSGFRSPLCPPLPSGLGQVRALSYYQPPGNCTIFVVPPHLCKWLLYIKKAEHQRIDAFELWCWRKLLRVPWTSRRSNQSILKENHS